MYSKHKSKKKPFKPLHRSSFGVSIPSQEKSIKNKLKKPVTPVTLLYSSALQPVTQPVTNPSLNPSPFSWIFEELYKKALLIFFRNARVLFIFSRPLQ
jgi:hypothetical protein